MSEPADFILSGKGKRFTAPVDQLVPIFWPFATLKFSERKMLWRYLHQNLPVSYLASDVFTPFFTKGDVGIDRLAREVLGMLLDENGQVFSPESFEVSPRPADALQYRIKTDNGTFVVSGLYLLYGLWDISACPFDRWLTLRKHAGDYFSEDVILALIAKDGSRVYGMDEALVK